MHRGFLAALVLTFAGGAAAVGYMGTASAGPAPPVHVNFTLPHQRPVPGQPFAGLAIVNVDNAGTLSSIECDADVAGKLLHARKQTFFTPGHKFSQVVVCSWRIPAGTGGKTLRLANGDHRAHVDVADTHYGSPEFSWRVLRAG
jgi:hypothetical protein